MQGKLGDDGREDTQEKEEPQEDDAAKGTESLVEAWRQVPQEQLIGKQVRKHFDRCACPQLMLPLICQTWDIR